MNPSSHTDSVSNADIVAFVKALSDDDLRDFVFTLRSDGAIAAWAFSGGEPPLTRETLIASLLDHLRDWVVWLELDEAREAAEILARFECVDPDVAPWPWAVQFRVLARALHKHAPDPAGALRDLEALSNKVAGRGATEIFRQWGLLGGRGQWTDTAHWSNGPYAGIGEAYEPSPGSDRSGGAGGLALPTELPRVRPQPVDLTVNRASVDRALAKSRETS